MDHRVLHWNSFRQIYKYQLINYLSFLLFSIVVWGPFIPSYLSFPSFLTYSSLSLLLLPCLPYTPLALLVGYQHVGIPIKTRLKKSAKELFQNESMNAITAGLDVVSPHMLFQIGDSLIY